MIVLLNAPAILYEVMSAARQRISISLGVPLEWVDFKLQPSEETGRLHPEVKLMVPDEIPEEHAKAKLFTESDSWRNEIIGAIVRTALREFTLRKEGARA